VANSFAQNYTQEAKEKLKSAEYNEAINLLQKAIEKNSTDTLAYNFMGQAYCLLNKFEIATSYYSIAIQFDPYDPDLHLLKGTVLYRSGKNDEALREFAIVDAICKYDKKRSQILIVSEGVNIEVRYFQSDYYLNYGFALFKDKKFKDALGKFEAAVTLAGGDIATEYLWRGKTYFKLGKYEKALSDFTVVDSMIPNKAVFNENIGICQYELGDYNNSIASMVKAIEIDPNNDDYYYWQGKSFYATNNYEKAIENYNMAIALDSTDSYNFKSRGDALKALGKIEEAQKDIEKASALQKQQTINE
jgi:Flp pilus assembly protein TadD